MDWFCCCCCWINYWINQIKSNRFESNWIDDVFFSFVVIILITINQSINIDIFKRNKIPLLLPLLIMAGHTPHIRHKWTNVKEMEFFFTQNTRNFKILQMKNEIQSHQWWIYYYISSKWISTIFTLKTHTHEHIKITHSKKK